MGYLAQFLTLSISGIQSEWLLLLLANASRLKNLVLGGGKCEYNYLSGKLSMWELCAYTRMPGRIDRVPESGVVRSGVGRLHLLCGGEPIPFHLQCVCEFGEVHIWQ